MIDGKNCTYVPFSDLALVVYIIQLWSETCLSPCLIEERMFHLKTLNPSAGLQVKNQKATSSQ